MLNIMTYDESKTKKKKRHEILMHAMNLFISDGIAAVSMQQISKTLGISPRSLYYYYSNKEELAVDIQILIMSTDWIFTGFILDRNKTGYEIVSDFLHHMIDYIKSHKKYIKYVAAFDNYFYNSYPGTRYQTHLDMLFRSKNFTDVIDEVRKDNTVLTNDRDMKTVLSTVYHSTMAYAQRIIYREKAMDLESSGDKGDLDLFVEFLLIGLKNPAD